MRARALIVGWFSLPWSGATAGDLAVVDVLAGWLGEAGIQHDVALDPPFEGGVDWRAVDPGSYTHVIHACGPVSADLAVSSVLDRFEGARKVAIDVSVVTDPETWNPFSDLIARDGFGAGRPDLAFAAEVPRAPVIGVVRVHPQLEYADGRHADADAAIDALLSRHRPAAAVAIDTQLDRNEGGLRSIEEVEALIARMDAVVTTRLHGLVFALRGGVPALAIDPVAGGAKVAAQARTVGWPAIVTADGLDPTKLDELFEHCLTETARGEARECAARARDALGDVRAELLAALERMPEGRPPAERLGGLRRRLRPGR